MCMPGVISVWSVCCGIFDRSRWAGLDQPDLWTSVVSSTGPCISPRLESGTSRAPGVNGAAASLESPWRVVGLRSSDTISHFPIYGLFFHFLVFSIYANVMFYISHCFALQRRLNWCIEFCRTLWQWIHRPVFYGKVLFFKEREEKCRLLTSQ